jgi:hypothetical protein
VDCETFQRRWQRLLDERLPPERDIDLVAHSLTCDSCHQQLSLREGIFSMLGPDEAQGPSPGFVDRVISELQSSVSFSESPTLRVPKSVRRSTRPDRVSADTESLFIEGPARKVRWRARRVAWGLALGLCLVLSLAVGRWQRDGAQDHLSGMVGRATVPAWSEQVPIEAPPRQDSVSSAWIAATSPRVDSWTNETTWDGPFVLPVPDSMGMIDSPVYHIWLAALTAQFPDVPPHSLQSVDQIAGGLRPVAVSFGAALETIRRSLPIVDREDRPVKPQAALASGVLIG